MKNNKVPLMNMMKEYKTLVRACEKDQASNQEFSDALCAFVDKIDEILDRTKKEDGKEKKDN